MPKFTERTALKEIVKIARREYRKKRPQSVRVVRMKGEKVFSLGGPIPAITVKTTQIPYYIIVLDYGDVYRLYNFRKDGTFIITEIVEKPSDKMTTIEKNTKVEYKIP